MTTKKPTTKKPKPPALKDLATRLGANLRRMDEMGRQITALNVRTAGLDERTDRQSRDIGELVHWKNAAHGKGDAPNIEAVMKRVAAMESRLRTAESGSGSHWQRQDRLEHTLAANAETHRSEVSHLRQAVASMDTRLGTSETDIRAILRWAKGIDHSGTVSMVESAAQVGQAAPTSPKGSALSEDVITSLANGLANFVSQRPSSEICSEGFRGTLRGFMELFLKSRGGL